MYIMFNYRYWCFSQGFLSWRAVFSAESPPARVRTSSLGAPALGRASVMSLAKLCLVVRQMPPDAGVTGLGHQEQAEHETHRGYRDRIDQCRLQTVCGLERRRGDQRHQPAAPAVTD